MPKSKTDITESNYIEVKNAKIHNLKEISINIPRDKFVVITGLSGSGKSSLAFNTLYAEGQRRYIESLSSYARQFLGKIKKPEVEYIKGIPPAIAIEQKVNTKNSRSTVGTSTEIYDYLKLFYARIGTTFSPKSGRRVEKHTVTDVVNFALKYPKGTKVMILAPIYFPKERSIIQQLTIIQQQGYTRILKVQNLKKSETKKVKNLESSDTLKIQDILSEKEKITKTSAKKDNYFIIIDRVKVSDNEDNISRIGDSVATSFFEGRGKSVLKIINKDDDIYQEFSNKFEADGIEFEEPTVHTFNFNNPIGACKLCGGFGKIIGISEKLVVPNQKLSLFEDGVACWRGEKMQYYKNQLIEVSEKVKFPIHKPYNQLTDKQKELLWNGNEYFEGINPFFKILESKPHKIQSRIILARYRGKTNCPDCKGTRLKKEASYVKIAGRPIQHLVVMQIGDLKEYFKNIKLTDYEKEVTKRILIEINSRLDFLLNVGLNYLTLNRLSSTLSGGESQRINLATSIGSSLVGALYILDEPTIGLHSRDCNRLIKVLRNLQEIGNTVVVVEHDEDVMREADEIIDMGPLAGSNGGEIVFQGNRDELIKAKNSLTAKYLTGVEKIDVPKNRRKNSKQNGKIEIIGATQNNLKDINISFPLKIMTVVTGVSGSGKSSLVGDILFPALQRKFDIYSSQVGSFEEIKGDFDKLKNVEFVDQNPIGRSSRSNPVTYIKAYDDIRKLFSQQQHSKINGFQPSHFSFNVDGGRCDECQGDGTITIEMQFMADVILTCESCNGKRFKDDVLDVKFKGKNIYEVLDMTVDDAIDFFGRSQLLERKIYQKLQVLADVGLGYVKLGQASNSLSGGESQRIKLASFLIHDKKDKPTMFIFDEPTTGLHFHDIKKLLAAFNALLHNGHTIIIIEHNLEIIKNADWIIDIGAEGGADGGNIVFEGTPEDIIKCKKSHTGKYLKKVLSS